jgi:hypothetical protein
MARMTRLLAILLAAVLAACGGTRDFAPGGLSLTTQVMSTWKEPKYLWPPMGKMFVISLMKVEPGGRDAVEDAIVKQLASAGVAAVASHTVMSKDAEKPGPTLEEAIKASGAEGVLMVEVKAIGAYEPYTVGQTITSLSPDTMASYNYLKGQNVYQPGDYKVAHIVRRSLPALDGQAGVGRVHQFVRRRRPAPQSSRLHGEARERNGEGPHHRRTALVTTKGNNRCRSFACRPHSLRSSLSPPARPRPFNRRGTTRATRAARSRRSS